MLKPFYKSSLLEAGTDESGRGCLAGPVVAAAVILPLEINFIFNSWNVENSQLKGDHDKNYRNIEVSINLNTDDFNLSNEFLKLIDDSKLLSKKTRLKLEPIIEKIAISFGISFQDPEIIDEINILNASLKAMRESILDLKVKPLYIGVDGNRPLTSISDVNEDGNRSEIFNNINYSCLVKGDSRFINIAAASVLAKNYRDAYMNKIHEEFPMYNWKKNKGYPTKEHREAIRNFGVTKYHRKSFRWLPEMTNLELLDKFNKL